MPHFLKIAKQFHVDALRQALEHNPHLFGQNNARAANYDSPHLSMVDIWVRYNALSALKDNPAAFNDEHDSVWYPGYYALPALKPILFDLMHFVDGERLGGVLITKVPPGGTILPHVDGGWHAGYYEKFYLPIKNEPGAIFGFPDGVIQGKPGEVYWFDNSVSHWVENNSTVERMALIVCIKTDKFKGMR